MLLTLHPARDVGALGAFHYLCWLFGTCCYWCNRYSLRSYSTYLSCGLRLLSLLQEQELFLELLDAELVLATALARAVDLVQRVIEFELRALAGFLEHSDLRVEVLCLCACLCASRLELLVLLFELRELCTKLVLVPCQFKTLLVRVNCFRTRILNALQRIDSLRSRHEKRKSIGRWSIQYLAEKPVLFLEKLLLLHQALELIFEIGSLALLQLETECGLTQFLTNTTTTTIKQHC